MIDDEKGWAVFAWGGAVIIFTEALLRLAVPKWRRSVMGSFIWGAVWAGVGFGLWFDEWEVIGPIVVIAIGVALLLGGSSRETRLARAVRRRGGDRCGRAQSAPVLADTPGGRPLRAAPD